MEPDTEAKNLDYCEKIKLNQLIDEINSLNKQINLFITEFMEFNEEQRKLANDLWVNVKRYNILNRAVKCDYSAVSREELLEELLVKIQDQSSKIHEAINIIRKKHDQLSLSNNQLEHHSDQQDWNPVTNFAIKGSVQHKSPSEYLEYIADIIYQFDIAITCMLHYFEALDIEDTSSFQNLMNSFSICRELSDFVIEFKINAQAIAS